MNASTYALFIADVAAAGREDAIDWLAEGVIPPDRFVEYAIEACGEAKLPDRPAEHYVAAVREFVERLGARAAG